MSDPHVLKIPEGAFEAQQSKEKALEFIMEKGQCPYCFGRPHDKLTEKTAKEHIDSHVLP